MKVLTWNVNKASLSRSGVWKYLEQEDADIVLLQEATKIPDSILTHYQHNIHSKFPRFFAGHNARFQTVVLSKWAMSKKPFLKSELDWVNKMHAERYGWLLGCEVVGDAGTRFRVVSVHVPAFHVPWESLVGVDISTIKLKGLGLEDCLSGCNDGRPVETFQHPRKIVEHQLDYVYVNAPLRRRLRSASVPSRADVFDREPRLSDHLPIVCEFD